MLSHGSHLLYSITTINRVDRCSVIWHFHCILLARIYIIVKASTYNIATWVFNLKPNLCLSVDLLWLVNTAWILYQKSFPVKVGWPLASLHIHVGVCYVAILWCFHCWSCIETVLHWIWSNVYDTLIILFECGNYLYIPVLYCGYSYTLIYCITLIGTNAYYDWWAGDLPIVF